jgi:hypothetical protein
LRALETALPAIVHVLTYIGTLTAFVLALGTFAWRVSRAVLLYRAGGAALKHGDKNPRGRAGLEVIKSLTGQDEPWWRAILPWRRSGDESGPWDVNLKRARYNCADFQVLAQLASEADAAMFTYQLPGAPAAETVAVTGTTWDWPLVSSNCDGLIPVTHPIAGYQTDGIVYWPGRTVRLRGSAPESSVNHGTVTDWLGAA